MNIGKGKAHYKSLDHRILNTQLVTTRRGRRFWHRVHAERGWAPGRATNHDGQPSSRCLPNVKRPNAPWRTVAATGRPLQKPELSSNAPKRRATRPRSVPHSPERDRPAQGPDSESNTAFSPIGRPVPVHRSRRRRVEYSQQATPQFPHPSSPRDPAGVPDPPHRDRSPPQRSPSRGALPHKPASQPKRLSRIRSPDSVR